MISYPLTWPFTSNGEAFAVLGLELVGDVVRARAVHVAARLLCLARTGPDRPQQRSGEDDSADQDEQLAHHGSPRPSGRTGPERDSAVDVAPCLALSPRRAQRSLTRIRLLQREAPHAVSIQRSNFQPTSGSTPTRSKPQARCSASLASFGSAITASTWCTPSARSRASRSSYSAARGPARAPTRRGRPRPRGCGAYAGRGRYDDE